MLSDEMRYVVNRSKERVEDLELFCLDDRPDKCYGCTQCNWPIHEDSLLYYKENFTRERI